MKKLLEKWNSVLERSPIVAMIVMSFAVELIIELLGHKNPLNAFVFIIRTPHLFVLCAGMIFFTMVFCLLHRRRVFHTLVAAMFWLIAGIVNWATLSFRTTPFSARDFSVIASGLQIADVYFTPLELIGLIAAFVAVVVIIVLLFIKGPRCEEKPNYKKAPIIIVCTAAVIAVFGIFGTGHIKLSAQYESINEAYEKCGFPYCFASSIFHSGIDKPENYSAEAVKSLGVDNSTTARKKPNIVILQLESFFDPALINGVELNENPIPNFTSLRDSCASGYLRVPTLGAGTVNAEFEVLTGMSLDYFGIGEYPFETVLRENTCESIAYDLKSLGYKCHAIHDYTGSFYGRNEVYPNLGFDDFTSVEYMHGMEYTDKGWTKDAVLTDYVMQALEQTEETDLVYTVSVQCHGKYPTDSDDIEVSIKDDGVFSGSEEDEFKYFVTQLKGTDEFVGALIERLKDFDEDTVVVAYGDHLPTLGITEEDLASGTLFQTQYFIWSNYGPGIGGSSIDLSAYQLTSHLFEMIGIDGGVVSEYHKTHRGYEGYQEGLEILEYDLLYGDKLAYNGRGPYEPADMKMGLDEIKITSVKFGEELVLGGSGFTEYSVIYINGKRCEDTVYVSPEELRLPNAGEAIGMDDEIEVCQTGPDRKILSTAKDLTH